MDPKVLVAVSVRILLVLVACMVLLRLLENRFVFFPEKIPLNAPLSRIHGSTLEVEWLQTVDAVRLNGWLITPQNTISPSGMTILYLHGNAGSLFDRIDRMEQLAAQGWRVFAVDYRGYGWSEGRPSEKGFYRDAASAYEFLVGQKHVDPRGLFFYGESLGTAVAIELAVAHPCAGLILEAPFTSFRDMGKARLFFIPGFIYRFLSNEWNSIDRIQRLSMPKFIIHGDRDGVVPFEQGRLLFEAAPPPKTFYPIHGADHMECLERGGTELMKRLDAFFCEAHASAMRRSPVQVVPDL